MNKSGKREYLYQKTVASKTISVWDENNQRILAFDNDNSQTSINLSKPHDLLLSYLVPMMASIQLSSKSENKILIIGLGGGAMIHYLNKFYPQSCITVIESVPEVIAIANKYFNLSSKQADLELVLADAFIFMKENKTKYDVILSDLPLMDYPHYQALFELCYRSLSDDGVCAFNAPCFSQEAAKSLILSWNQQFHYQALSIPVKNSSNLVLIAYIERDVNDVIQSLIDQKKLGKLIAKDPLLGHIRSDFSY